MSPVVEPLPRGIAPFDTTGITRDERGIAHFSDLPASLAEMFRAVWSVIRETRRGRGGLVGTDEQRYRARGRAGARLEALDGLGYWWMTHGPERGAAVLTRFWASL